MDQKDCNLSNVLLPLNSPIPNIKERLVVCFDLQNDRWGDVSLPDHCVDKSSNWDDRFNNVLLVKKQNDLVHLALLEGVYAY